MAGSVLTLAGPRRRLAGDAHPKHAAEGNRECPLCEEARSLGSVVTAYGGLLNLATGETRLPARCDQPGPDQLELWNRKTSPHERGEPA